MRLLRLLPVILVAACAASARAAVIAPGDAALLARAPTAQEQQLASIAGVLAGHRVRMRCGKTSGPDLGFVAFSGSRPADYAIVSSNACTLLARFAARPGDSDARTCAQPTSDDPCLRALLAATEALQTLAHESFHLWGARAEAKAECYGMQNIWFVASRLGASAAQAQALGAWYWRVLYPSRRTDAPTYWSAECRNGGKLDLRPASALWPS